MAHGRNRVLRGGIQARAHRISCLPDAGPRAYNQRSGWPAGCAAVRSHRQGPRRPRGTRSVTSTPCEVGIAIVGYGGMGKAHSYAYRVAPMIDTLACEPRVRVITGRNPEAVERAARAYNIPEWSTDWRAAIQRPDVDIVDVCTPPGTHPEIIEAAAQAGKAVVCEKPLAT